MEGLRAGTEEVPSHVGLTLEVPPLLIGGIARKELSNVGASSLTQLQGRVGRVGPTVTIGGTARQVGIDSPLELLE